MVAATLYAPRPARTPASRWWQRAATWAVLLGILVGVGCGGLPQRVERQASWSLPAAEDTPLARLVQASTLPLPAPQSGFRLLADGADALATRLALIRAASRSLDLQYFLISDDASGEQLLGALRAAAERGVRVRLLLDDLHAGAHEASLVALDRHAHAEVRLFNPLPVRGGSLGWRLLGSLHEFERINRRMHNKLFIADGRIAEAGGRNIGDDYFMRGMVANFIDLDILATGPVVDDWGSCSTASGTTTRPVPRAACWAAAAVAPVGFATADAADIDGSAAQIRRGRLELHFGSACVFAGAPSKATRADARLHPCEAMAQSLALMSAARTDVTIASPYFVPGPGGLALMREAAARGIHIAVRTNSLSATDEPLAYRGYRCYRLPMLKMGVRLADLSPVHSERAAAHGSARSSLGRPGTRSPSSTAGAQAAKTRRPATSSSSASCPCSSACRPPSRCATTSATTATRSRARHLCPWRQQLQSRLNRRRPQRRRCAGNQ